LADGCEARRVSDLVCAALALATAVGFIGIWLLVSDAVDRRK
jgi:hypothetical protein